MKRIFSAVLLLLLLAGSGSVLADGGLFGLVRDKILPGLPYQRAVIIHDGEKELLCLQAMFHGRGSVFGWVVPVPAEPVIARLPSREIESNLKGLAWTLRPVEVSLTRYLVLLLAFVPMLFFAAALVAWGRGKGMYPPSPWPRMLAGYGVKLLVLGALLGVGAYFWQEYQDRGAAEELPVQPVALYEVQAVKGEAWPAVAAWVKANGFALPDADRAVLEDYARRGWRFVTARVKADRDGKLEGLSEPLVLSFSAQRPVYPLALSGAGNSAAEIELFVYAPHRMDGDARLPVKYSGGAMELVYAPTVTSLKTFQQDAVLEGFNLWQKSYLTVFHGSLTPDSMKEDFSLKPAAVDEEFRRVVYTGRETAIIGGCAVLLVLAVDLLLLRRRGRRKGN